MVKSNWIDWCVFQDTCEGRDVILESAEQNKNYMGVTLPLDISEECPNVGKVFKIKKIWPDNIHLELDGEILNMKLTETIQYWGSDNGFVIGSLEEDGFNMVFKFI